MILNYNHTEIYYKLEGQGPTIVLLHGFLASSTMWEEFIPKIAKSKTILVIDLPGHGKSGCLSETHSMELMAEVLQSILEKHEINSVSIIGYSMGGYVALAFVELYNHKIDKLVLLNSTPAKDSEERRHNRDRALKVIARNPKAFISMAISNLFVKSTQYQYDLEIQKMKKEANTLPIEGINAAIRGMKNRKDRNFVLKKFSKEKLMICAINDPLISYEVSKSLALQTNTELRTVSGGHMSLVEKFDEIVKICV